MSFHSDLLIQAEYLANKESKRPKQASLRRAISAAYYALFHLLTDEASRLFVRDPQLINSINRVYSHGEMDTISKSFAKGELPKAFAAVKAQFPAPQEIQDVAQAFVDLQQARHDADYNLARKFTRTDALGFVDRAKQAFADWKNVRKTDYARIYLASFILWKQWDKTR